jgi:membrane associated rhomboid family serine protease
MSFALPPLTPVTKKLMILNVGIFLVSWILSLILPGVQQWLYEFLALRPGQWADWFPFVPVWQLLSHGFLHSTQDPTHVLWNMVQLYFFGTMLEGIIGGRRFLTTYLLCMFAGGLLHVFVELATGTPTGALGASGAALGVVVAVATLRPRVQVLLIFIPVMLWVLAAGIVGLNFINAITELVKGGSSGVAYWVHLGGAAYGFACVRLGWIQTDWVERWRSKRVLAAESRRRDDDFQMDRLLEKIHKEGMGNLTKSEREFLKRSSSRK